MPELLSKSFNFQNLSDLNEAYDGMWGSEFLTHICTTDVGPCAIGGSSYRCFTVSEMCPDWLEIIKNTFLLRHKIVHDANFKPDIDIEDVKKSELLFLLVPQVASIFIAQRFKDTLPRKPGDENWLPAIMTTKDLLGEWFIADESEK